MGYADHFQVIYVSYNVACARCVLGQVLKQALDGSPQLVGGRQVIYARKFDSPLYSEEHSAERIMKALQVLFLPTSDSITQIVPLSSLLEMIKVFSHSDREVYEYT